MNNTNQKILAYLFSEAGSVAFSDMAKYFSLNVDEVKNTVNELVEWSQETPFTIVATENDASFVLNSEMSQTLSDLDTKDTERELTKAALETMSIILYKNGATRSEIDYIRGVNSSFSIRSLSARGYIERGPKNTYVPTTDALMFMGVTKVSDLPEYEKITNNLNEVIQTND